VLLALGGRSEGEEAAVAEGDGNAAGGVEGQSGGGRHGGERLQSHIQGPQWSSPLAMITPSWQGGRMGRSSEVIRRTVPAWKLGTVRPARQRMESAVPVARVQAARRRSRPPCRST